MKFSISFFCFLFFFLAEETKASIKDFLVEYTEPSELNYGTEINFKFYYKNKKGKKKDLKYNDRDNIKIEVTNGDFNFYAANYLLAGKLVLLPRPLNSNDSIVKIKFTYLDDGTGFSREFDFTLNYKGKMVLNFNGRDGAPGGNSADGKLFFTSGAEGNQGHNGENGKHLRIEVLPNSDSTNQELKVILLATNETFSYLLKPATHQIFIMSNGGNGGKGGDGNDGNSNKENRLDGGDGGNGGHGGNGGQITVYIPKKLAEVRKKIVLMNYGGLGGASGKGGAGVEFSDDKTKKGRNGFNGMSGNSGLSGNPPEIVIGE